MKRLANAVSKFSEPGECLFGTCYWNVSGGVQTATIATSMYPGDGAEEA